MSAERFAVSVIVPALDAEATLAHCLDALTAQASAQASSAQASDDTEVIVVDDGSTDRTFEIASRYRGAGDCGIWAPWRRGTALRGLTYAGSGRGGVRRWAT
jgi:glycosyltransferase involved in cell wall biosynthesis